MTAVSPINSFESIQARLAGGCNPAVVIRNWWPVYGTLVGVGCLGLMFWLTGV
ncbi:MAG TPA: hypothetical protein VLH85_08975 [Levilinea sp.]|nr:hypothetical protein [Levilinea sp.]